MSEQSNPHLTPHFRREEMACPHCGKCSMDQEFLDKLEALRLVVRAPFSINSGYRCPTHDKAVGGKGKPINHVAGMAVDIGINGTPAFKIIALAKAFGFTGLGMKQHGPREKRFLHLDTYHKVWTCWTYE